MNLPTNCQIETRPRWPASAAGRLNEHHAIENNLGNLGGGHQTLVFFRS